MSGDAFLPRGVREEPVQEQDRTEARTAHRVFRGADGFEVAVPERILARAVAIGESHAPLEWIGQLVGTRYCDERGHHVVVEAIVQDLGAKREPHFVTSTHASEGHAKALAREQYPDAVILGWIHGHVRHGVHYSRRDFENQATWTDPDSIGIVVDPWDPARLAVYRGPGGELLAPVAESALMPCASDPSPPTPPGAATVPPSEAAAGRGSRRRSPKRSLLLEMLAFGVGVWMGRAEVRVEAIERRCAVSASAATPRSGEAATRRDAPEPAYCARGRRASEYAKGGAALQCLAPVAPPRHIARNASTKGRMEESDTPR